MQDELDPAVKIVRQLMEAYPLVNSRLFTGRLRTKISVLKTETIDTFNVEKYFKFIFKEGPWFYLHKNDQRTQP